MRVRFHVSSLHFKGSIPTLRLDVLFYIYYILAWFSCCVSYVRSGPYEYVLFERVIPFLIHFPFPCNLTPFKACGFAQCPFYSLFTSLFVAPSSEWWWGGWRGLASPYHCSLHWCICSPSPPLLSVPSHILCSVGALCVTEPRRALFSAVCSTPALSCTRCL